MIDTMNVGDLLIISPHLYINRRRDNIGSFSHTENQTHTHTHTHTDIYIFIYIYIYIYIYKSRRFVERDSI